MSEEKKKIELTEQELDQAAGGQRLAAGLRQKVGETKRVPPVVSPIAGRTSAG